MPNEPMPDIIYAYPGSLIYSEEEREGTVKFHLSPNQEDLTEAVELLKKSTAMLNAASCPACDGGGGIPHGDPHDETTVEWEQCQWCDEQKQIDSFLSKRQGGGDTSFTPISNGSDYEGEI